MEKIVEELAKLDIAQLGILIGAMWMFYKRLDKKFDAINKKFDKIDESISLMNQDIKELRTSLNRMEGAFYSKECCMLKDEKQLKKAE